MICEYYSSAVQQVRSCLGKQKQNIVMVQYSNDFSIDELKNMPCFSQEKEGIVYTWHEFPYHEIAGGYEPFLDIICQVFGKYGDGDFSKFLSECGVYVPHREVLESYERQRNCVRREMVILDEVKYEQKRMTRAIGQMLRRAAEYCPMVIVLNHFQLASRSTMELVRELMRHPSENIGIVLGVNDKPERAEGLLQCWEEINEGLADCNHIYHIGNSERKKDHTGEIETGDVQDFESLYRKINNTAELLDYEQAFRLCRDMLQGIQFGEDRKADEKKLKIYPLYARVSILCGDFATALEVIYALKKLKVERWQDWIACVSEYYLATCRMYQGKLGRSFAHTQNAMRAAERAGSEEWKLKAEMLGVQARMSGWYNLFFCLNDIEVSEELLEALEEKGYYNFLAHTYVYAYDNDPEVVAKAYQQEQGLAHFNRGIELAQKIGNEHLVYNAHQKNSMIADTYGFYQAAVYYLLQAYQFETEKRSLECGRIYSALGYNFSALGMHRIAKSYYNQAIALFLQKKMPEEIAEIYYNMAMDCIMEGKYAQAERQLQLCVKAMDKLRLNSLRVCSPTKLYGLLALASILQKDSFGCRRYLEDCGQLLSNSGGEVQKFEEKHDYALLNDEKFLYWFSSALFYQEEGNLQEAHKCFKTAEQFLEKSKSNQFYAYSIFYEKWMVLLQESGHTEQLEEKRAVLEQYVTERELVRSNVSRQVQEVRLWEQGEAVVDEQQIEELIKQEGMERELRNIRRRMDFLYAWQNMIDASDMDIKNTVSNGMQSFLNQFGNDCAVYVRYRREHTSVLYNDTGVEITPDLLEALKRAMKKYPQGFAVSKIRGNFQRHRDIISYFGEEKVCSFAAVPFFKNGRLDSVVLTYILMKNNWRTTMESYMINEGDLSIYQLLFRELGYCVNRIESYEKIYEMNQKLTHAASTDMLTGLYNRTGLYHELEKLMVSIRQGSLGLMFIDLDNFKYYNDTYGHQVGDVILISMAKVFQKIIGTRGIVSRYGGDEFLIILKDIQKDEMERFACEIYRELEEESGFDEEISGVLGYEVVVDEAHKITCSIGIAINDNVQEEEDIHELIRKADDILYTIKKTKKGTYAFFS